MSRSREPMARPADKREAYLEIDRDLAALLDGESDLVANTANTAALLYESLPDLNWAGFYFARAAGDLVLGPFQGRPACTRIAPGRGVCGAAAAARRTLLVQDVHVFPGHIACDSASNSEIVVPLLRHAKQDNGTATLLGVMDLDSPRPARFDAQDQAGLERIAATLLRSLG